MTGHNGAKIPGFDEWLGTLCVNGAGRIPSFLNPSRSPLFQVRFLIREWTFPLSLLPCIGADRIPKNPA